MYYLRPMWHYATDAFAQGQRPPQASNTARSTYQKWQRPVRAPAAAPQDSAEPSGHSATQTAASTTPSRACSPLSHSSWPARSAAYTRCRTCSPAADRTDQMNPTSPDLRSTCPG